ncbi:Endophilin-A2, partial [Fulmarus glacialis]
GDALLDAGESMKRLAEVKDSLDIEVKQNFIDPLQNLCDKDLKEIQHHLKKLEGRRLDFDYKKKRQGKIPDEELRQAMEKFEESKEVAETSMHNLLETDIEQVSQLSALVDAQLDYHRQAVQILDELAEKLKRSVPAELKGPGGVLLGSRGQAGSVAQRHCGGESSWWCSNGAGGLEEPHAGEVLWCSPLPLPPLHAAPLDQPCCKALYDFEPENDGELGFKEGDIITLTNQIDENWYEGMINGQSGFFPLNYVEVLVPLPQ